MEKYYFGEKNIRTFEDWNLDKKKQLNSKCKRLSLTRQKDLEKEWWATNYTGEYTPYNKKIFELRQLLLSFGGKEVVLPVIEEDLGKILDRGNLWVPDVHNRVKYILGERSQCHKNSCELWEVNKEKFDIRICTGYALSDDSVWRQHSFLVVINKKTKNPKIIETTLKRIAYYGYIMSEEECEEFVFNNY